MYENTLQHLRNEALSTIFNIVELSGNAVYIRHDSLPSAFLEEDSDQYRKYHINQVEITEDGDLNFTGENSMGEHYPFLEEDLTLETICQIAKILR